MTPEECRDCGRRFTDRERPHECGNCGAFYPEVAST
jgi:rubrerythrin